MDWKLEVVIVPVGNVDEAKQFYSEKLNFVVDHDTEISDSYRVVQLTPPGSGCSIVIGSQNHGMLPGSLKGLQLVVNDINKARLQLLENKIEVSTVKHYEGTTLVEGAGGKWNSFIFFSDPYGNEWVIQERPRDT